MDYNELQSQTPNQKPTNKSSSNLKWILVIGCGSLLAMGLCIVLFAGGIVTAVFGALRSSDVYTEALAAAQESEEVIDTLGEPVEAGWLISGSIETSGGSGSADLSIPISGTDGSGDLIAVARREAGQWEFSRLYVEVDNGPRLNLLRGR